MAFAIRKTVFLIIIYSCFNKAYIFTLCYLLRYIKEISYTKVTYKFRRISCFVMHYQFYLQSGISFLCLTCGYINTERIVLCPRFIHRHIKIFYNMIIISIFFAVRTVKCIKPCKSSGKTCIVVIGYFVVYVILCLVMMIVFGIRSADKCTIKNMFLFTCIFTF